MANTNSASIASLNAGSLPDVKKFGGRLKVFQETIALASQASGDTITVLRLPAGFVPLWGQLVSDTSLGSSTISIGTAASAAKYRAAATFTPTDTPTPFGKAANLGAALAASEDVLITIATAALPASGTLQVQMFGLVGD
jgi:hypothetical protein